MSAEFKVGDVVRLTGYGWASNESKVSPVEGDEVVISGVNSYGEPTFLYEGDTRSWIIIRDSGYGAELVKPYRTLAEKRQDDFEVLERASRPWRDAPDYYKFPRDVQTTDISMHLNSNGGQAVGYISRSTRIDGLNKEDDPRDSLRKAIDLIQMEIYRLDEKFGTKSEESE